MECPRLSLNQVVFQNNAFFELQHSINARDFETVGNISGNGTIQVKHTSAFAHTGLPAETIRYCWLRRVDIDGKMTTVRPLPFGLMGI